MENPNSIPNPTPSISSNSVDVDLSPSPSPSPSPTSPLSSSSSSSSPSPSNKNVLLPCSLEDFSPPLSPSPFDFKYPHTAPTTPVIAQQWLKCTSDGGVLKYILTVGNENESLPPPLTRCYIHLSLCIPNGQIIIDSLHDEYDFTLGQANTALCIDMATCNMRVGEIALVRATEKYSFNQHKLPPTLPKDSPLFLYIHLIRWEKEPNSNEISDLDKVKWADTRRPIGRELYSKGKYLSAIKQFKRGMLMLEGLEKTVLDEFLIIRKDETLLTLKSNLSLCYMKINDLSSAYAECNAVYQKIKSARYYKISTKWKELFGKSLYRRGEIHRKKDDIEECDADWKEILRDEKGEFYHIDEETIRVIKTQMVQIKEQMKERERKEREKYTGFMKAKAPQGEGGAVTLSSLYDDKPDIAPVEKKKNDFGEDIVDDTDMDAQMKLLDHWKKENSFINLMGNSIRNGVNGMMASVWMAFDSCKRKVGGGSGKAKAIGKDENSKKED